jgi:hypothetical protein
MPCGGTVWVGANAAAAGWACGAGCPDSGVEPPADDGLPKLGAGRLVAAGCRDSCGTAAGDHGSGVGSGDHGWGVGV